MKKILLFLAAAVAFAQEPSTVPLWPNGAPGALGDEDRDKPTLAIFLPTKNQAAGVGLGLVVCPGANYVGLASNHEARQVANGLNAKGTASFGFNYRQVPPYHNPTELGDVQR